MSMTRILLFLLLISSVFGEETPYSKVKITPKNALVLRTGGESDFEVNINLPHKHYLYLSHTNKDAIGILTNFSFPIESGFQLIETKRPKGVKKFDEMILRESGTFSFKAFELGLRKNGSNAKIPMSIRIQICEEKENPVCYPPETLIKEVIAEVRDDKRIINTREIESISWETDFENAITKAKASNLNIYGIITEPSWCGACRYMEQEAFSKPEMKKVLKEKFIPWKIKDEEYNKVPLGNGTFGIPTYFVLNPNGSSLAKWTGARDSKSLLTLLKPYEKSNPSPELEPSPPSPDSSEFEVKGNDESKCTLLIGKDYNLIAQKSGEFLNDGKIRFGFNNQELKIKQFSRNVSNRKAYPVKFTTLGLRIEKPEIKEYWVLECKNSILVGKIEGSQIEFSIEK